MPKLKVCFQGVMSFILASTLCLPIQSLAFAAEDSENVFQNVETTANLNSDSTNSTDVSSNVENEDPNDELIDETSNLTEDEQYDESAISAEDALQFLLLMSPTLTPQDEQEIAIGLIDEAVEIDHAKLTLRHVWSDEEKVVDSSFEDTAKYAAVFRFAVNDWNNGDWVFVSFEYSTTKNDDFIKVDLAQVDPGYFTIAKDENDPAHVDTVVENSFYVADGDSLEQVSSIEEAISEATDDAIESAPTPQKARSVAAKSRAASNIVVGLDPGHGGYDPGAVGYAREADLTWKIAKYCEAELYEYPDISNVAFSRSQDETTNDNSGGLYNRVKRLKDAGANIVVSIHLNATTGGTGGSGSGAEVYAPNGSYSADIHNQGVTLAALIAQELHDQCGINLRGSLEGHAGVKDRTSSDGTSDYYGIIRNAKSLGLPGIIVEHCFIDSSDYSKYLDSEDKIRRLGVADATGIAKYFGISKWTWDAKVTASQINKDGTVRITVDGSNQPDGITYVNLPTWGSINGQNDLIWYSAKKSGNDWILDIPLSKHREFGTYNVHAYAGMSSGGQKFIGATSFEVKQSQIFSGDITATPNREKGTIDYVLEADSVFGLSSVSLACWCSSVGGQNDIRWYPMQYDAEASKKIGKSVYTLQVNMAAHQYEVGNYAAHIYVSDKVGFSGCIAMTSTQMELPPMNLEVSGQSSTRTISISGGALANASSVYFPTWSSAGGQDDIVWYGGSKNNQGVWTATVNLANHRTSGLYHVHVYAVINGSMRSVNTTTFEVAAPEATLEVVGVDKDAGTISYKASVKSSTGISSVQLPTWCSSVGGQDDIRWYGMSYVSQSDVTKASSSVPMKQYDYTLTINMANHGYQVGNYASHLYAYDGSGILASVAKANTEMVFPPVTLKIGGNDTDTARTITLSGKMCNSISRVQFPTWSVAGGQDDIVWYSAYKNGNGEWVANVPLNNHKTSGEYLVHCYITTGNSTLGIAGTSFNVDPSVLPQLGYSIMGTSKTSVDQMVRRFNSLGKTYPSIYASKGAPTIRDFCQILWEEATAENVSAEVIFCQSMLETGWLRFGGAVLPEQCNFAGIGAIDSDPRGSSAWFDDVRTGLRAQVQHLRAYADRNCSQSNLRNGCVDPRFNLVSPKGKAPTVESLGNGNWASSKTYGADILVMISELMRA